MTPRHGSGRLGASLLGVAVALACSDSRPTHLTLRSGLALSSRLASEGTSAFTFDLRRDQFVELAVSQTALDSILTLVSPKGERSPPLDTQTTEKIPERLTFLARQEGRYRLEVKGTKTDAGKAFRLEVRAFRSVRPRDRGIAEAQEQLNRAEALRRQKLEPTDLRALPLYAEAARLYGEAKDDGAESYVHLQWARFLLARDRQEEGLAQLRRSLAVPASRQPAGLRARVLTILVTVLSDRGELGEADRRALEALELWRQLDKPAFQAEILSGLAQRASSRGELAQAEGFYGEALKLARTGGDPSFTGLVLNNLASFYTLSGEPRLALDAADDALATIGPRGIPSARSKALEQRGEALMGLGRSQEGKDALASALALLRGEESLALARLERRLARHAYEAGQLAEAAEGFRKALSIYEKKQDRPSASATRQNLAWAELKLGRLDSAERLYGQVAKDSEESGNLWIEAASLAGRARLAQRRGDLDAALSLVNQSLEVVETLRGAVGRPDLRVSVFADQQTYFDLAVDLTLERYDQTRAHPLLVQAFEISERSRARRLLDLIEAGESASASGPGDGLPSKPEGALKRAEERLAFLRRAEAAGAAIEEAERDVRKAVLEVRRAEASPVPSASLGDRAFSFSRIQRWVAPDAALLEFDLGDDASYLWVVTGRSLKVHRLPPKRQVETEVRKAMDLLSHSGLSVDSTGGKRVLAGTFQLLLGAAWPDLQARRWLVVMDGALQALPLGALPNPESPELPLLATHEIAFAPSATVAVRLAERQRGRRAATGQDLALFADAVYEAEAAGGARPASYPPARRSASGLEGTTRGGGPLDLTRLRYAGEEARRILEMVRPEARLAARRFDATKSRVLSGDLRPYRRLHFAVHGLPNEEHAELSGLALSSVDREGRRLDGLLHAFEIARLQLSADLVTLSSCRSAGGEAISGEGIVGLAHAFFTAGAARVVTSAWAVDDEATAALMSRFYEGLLLRQLPPARALREAQLEVASREPWRRPYYWAAFFVQGGF